MFVYSQLEVASLENLSADPTNLPVGRIWYDTALGVVKIAKSTGARKMLANDGACVFGTSSTASDNIRLHRSAVGTLQFVSGSDVTAEASNSTALAKLSFRFESYTDAGKPAVGNAGRVVYVSDLATFLGDNGSAWVPLGGSGGGSALKWVESDLAPTPSIDAANVQVFSFQSGQGQALYALIQVPSGYTAGRPISLKVNFYSPDNTGNALMQAVATLVRPGTDAFNSVTNQRTSTNAAVALGAGTVNIPQQVTFDLTSATGTINGVAVAAGHYILVKLTRGTDTALSDLAVQPDSTQVAFF